MTVRLQWGGRRRKVRATGSQPTDNHLPMITPQKAARSRRLGRKVQR